jgi:crotonobetainyl-CoA:carnitine CoA-transferase CaiB-like acyl-CoA transferase
MTEVSLGGLRIAVAGNLLATQVAAKLLRDAGAIIEPFSIGQQPDILLGDRKSLAAIIGQKELDPVFPGLRALLGERTVFLEFTHEARGNETDARHPSERAAASEAGLYESLVPFMPPNVFDQPVCSFLAGIHAATAVIAAENWRGLGARATEISVPLVAVGRELLGLQSLFAFEYPKNWQPVRWMASPYKDAWRTRDGSFIYLHVGLAHHLARFLDVLAANGYEKDAANLRSLISAETLADPVEPVGFLNTAKVVCTVRSLMLRDDGAHWEKIFSAGGLCCIRVRSFEEWVNSDLAEQCGFVSHNIDIDGTKTWKYESFVRMQLRQLGVHAQFGSVSLGKYPLSGMRVLDFSQVIAGPVAGRSFLEMGAEVLRIENPLMRQSFVEPFAAAFHAGKSVVSVDLRAVEGKAAVTKIIQEWRPHVVLHNFGRGVPEKLGIGENELRKHNPSVIYLDINAYGDCGPLAMLPGFEQTAQALCGVAHESSKNGRPSLFLLPIHDMGAGLLGAFGVVCAWRHFLRDGEGARVHCSLASASMLLQSVHPSRCSSSEMSMPHFRGERFSRQFHRLEAENNWILERVAVQPGFDARVVHIPVWTADWLPVRFGGHKIDSQLAQKFTKIVGVNFLGKIAARAKEIAWGIWWILRQAILN